VVDEASQQEWEGNRRWERRMGGEVSTGKRRGEEKRCRRGRDKIERETSKRDKKRGSRCSQPSKCTNVQPTIIIHISESKTYDIILYTKFRI
jgi:hypothetical protein